MLRFDPDFRIHVLPVELAVILHHASVWSAVQRIGVVVVAGANGQHGPDSLHAWSLALDLDTDSDHAVDLALLGGYLARILPAGYDVAARPGHVHVAWDPGRRPAAAAESSAAAAAAGG